MLKHLAIVTLIAATSTLPTLAQTPEPAPVGTEAPKTAPVQPKLPPLGSGPQQSSATFGDWMLRCRQGADARKSCEAVATIRAGDPQHTAVAEFVFGRLSKAEPQIHATAHLPTTIAIPSVVKFTTADLGAKALEIPYHRCLPIGCYADIVLTDAQIKNYRNQKEDATGALEFTDGTDHQVKFSISMRGLTQVLDALAKEY